MSPLLLVSVRNETEALSALDGGANIIDVKEPDRGALGRSDFDVISGIVAAVRRRAPGTVVSAAMGEIADWNCAELCATGSASAAPNHGAGADSSNSGTRMFATDGAFADSTAPDLFKAGPAGSSRGTNADWVAAWKAVQSDLQRGPTNWVSVSYADYARCDAPAPERIFEAGDECGSPVLLVDTFEKDGTTLLDWLSAAELQSLRERTRSAGMKLALAGRVSAENIDRVLTFEPDIIAVRGAVCGDGDRRSTVSAERVRTFSAGVQVPDTKYQLHMPPER